MSKITNFLGEVGSEMRKTSWPKSKELTKYTVVVISTVIFFAFMLLNNMHWQLFPYFLNLGSLFWFSSAADENSAFTPYLFPAHSSHPAILLPILPM